MKQETQYVFGIWRQPRLRLRALLLTITPAQISKDCQQNCGKWAKVNIDLKQYLKAPEIVKFSEMHTYL